MTGTWFTYDDGFVHLKKLPNLKTLKLKDVLADEKDIARFEGRPAEVDRGVEPAWRSRYGEAAHDVQALLGVAQIKVQLKSRFP